MVHCKSTRGHSEGTTFEETLFTGWLHDCSLFVPEHVPCLTTEQFDAFRGLTYQEICLEIFALFVGDEFMSRADLQELIGKSLSTFPSDAIPLHRLDEDNHVLELYHGPTCSFKDVSLCMVGPLMNHALKRNNKHGLVYISTSGDTGSAVIHASKGLSNMDILTFYSGFGRISKVQELLMSTVSGDNLHTFAGNRGCDDFDAFFRTFSNKLKLLYPDLVVTTMNSIIWPRIMLQTAHQIYTYLKVTEEDRNKKVRFVIPTGGAGHMAASALCVKMGLPIQIVAALNSSNDNLYKLLVGDSMVYPSSTTTTYSSAMDIQEVPNIERVIYFLLDQDTARVKELCDPIYEPTGGELKLSKEELQRIHKYITTIQCDNDEIINIISACWKEFQYVVDPHTAVGLKQFFDERKTSSVGDTASKEKQTTVYFSTASPVKFSDILHQAGVPTSPQHKQFEKDILEKETFEKNLPEDETEWMDYFLKYVVEFVLKK